MSPTREGFCERQTRPPRGDLLHHAALPPQILDAMEPTREGFCERQTRPPRGDLLHRAALPPQILDAMSPTREGFCERQTRPPRGDLLHHAALPPQILDAMSQRAKAPRAPNATISRSSPPRGAPSADPRRDEPNARRLCERQTRPSRGDLLHHAALPPQILDAMSPTREGFRERQTRPSRGDLLHHVALPLGPLDGVCPRPERDGSVSVSKPRGESPRPRLDALSSLCVFERVDPPMERRGGGASGRASERLRHQSSRPRRLLHRFDPPLKRAPDPTETPPT